MEGRMSDHIGQYVTRYRKGAPNTTAHLVESIVADDAITRCGRRMRNERPSGMELRYVAVPAVRICRVCDTAGDYANDAVPEEA
jgi:hypothetical protein